VATWRWSDGKVLLEPFATKLAASAARALEREAADVARFLSS
jgi:hypothetical protein